MVTKEAIKLAKKLWDYHQMNQKLKKSDCILVLVSSDIRVTQRGAELYLQGWAPKIIFSGGFGTVTKGTWDESEADKFAAIAKKMGVPEKDILIENQSTNTGENIIFTRKLLEEKRLNFKTFIAVTKPYTEKRCYATFKNFWPSKDFIVTSPQITFEDYPNEVMPLEPLISHIVGDLQKIKIYPGRGYQIPMDIPDDMWQAYERLLELGYDKYLKHY